MAGIQKDIDKRTVARRKLTQACTLVQEQYDLAMKYDKDGKPEEAEQAVRRTVAARSELEKAYEALEVIQDQIDYNPDNEDRLKDLSPADKEKEEKTEKQYKEKYLDHLAKISNLEASFYKKERSKQSSSPRGKSPARSDHSNAMTAEDFTRGLSEAFKHLNTGISGDQLQQILGTLTQKKREIQIPIFKGEHDQFESWVELVEAEVEKPGYSDVEKAHLVKSLVDGDAKKLVLALRDPTYQNIMKALDNKYGDVHSRLQKAIVDISTIEPVSTMSVKDLDPLYTKLLSCWNYLMKKTNSNNHLIESSWVLTSLVRPKLPKALLRKWDSDSLKHEAGDDEDVNLPMKFDVMLTKIQEALTVARRSDGEKGGGSGGTMKKFVSRSGYSGSKLASGHALSTQSKPEDDESKDFQCLFCDKPHPPWECDEMKQLSVDERLERVQKKRACFNCLRTGHSAKFCRNQRRCRKCKRKHCDILHRNEDDTSTNQVVSKSKDRKPDDSKKNNKSKDDSDVKAMSGLVKVIQGPKKILMQSGLVSMISKTNEITGRCMFDTGCGVTFIRTVTAKRLNLKGKDANAEFTLAGGQSMKIKTQKVTFKISSVFPNWKGEVFEVVAYVLEKPCANLSSVDIDVLKIPQFQNLQFADNYPRGEVEVDLLLGLEDTLRIMLNDSVKDVDGALVAQKSQIGWILSGPCTVNTDTTISEEKYPFCRVDISDPTEIAVMHWDLEHVGILPEEEAKLRPLEAEALKQHKIKTVFVDGRYETGLLKHPDWTDKKLKSNKKMAENRLVSLENRLKREPELALKYKEQMDDLIQSERAELVCENEEPNDGRTVWYLPHHPVLKKTSTTTKTRIVNDGASKGPEGISINNTLIPGPALQPDILAILLRFRKHKVALIADVEKMFHQISINERDRDSLRFLWRDLKTNEQPKIYRMTRVVFGVKSSPFSSIKVVMDHVERCMDRYPEACSEIKDNIFVDDVISGADSIQEAASLATDMKNMMQEGGFPLRKFVSNRPECLRDMKEEDLASYHLEITDNEALTKVLGVKYKPKNDILMFGHSISQDDVDTRRTMLQKLNQLFDPMGLLTPFTVRGKMLFQQSWVDSDWDDVLRKEIQDQWSLWLSDIPVLGEIEIQRCIVPEHFKDPKFSLHGYGDASELAYATSVYLLIEDQSTGEKYCELLCSKSRVAPLKTRRSIPELELMAALINARLVKYVENQMKMKIDDVYCWSDSKVVLEWLRKPGYTWQVFVGRRVSEIQGLVPSSNWKHVPGSENPADLASRGCSAEELINCKKWWHGPEYLLMSEENWPSQDRVSTQTAVETAMKKKSKSFTEPIIPVATVTQSDGQKSSKKDDVLSTYSNLFSSYFRFIRAMAFVRNCFKKKKFTRMTRDTEEKLRLWNQEETFWLKLVQNKEFPTEVKLLSEKKLIPKTSRLIQLDPFLDDDGLVRVGGRIQQALLPEEMVHPIVLPPKDDLVEKLVMRTHLKECHTGPMQTLANLRLKYWLLRGRSEISRIQFKCKCKDPEEIQQKMGELPKERVNVSPPFSCVGLDFAGPLYAKKSKNVDKKVYIALFTCMATRACHLELVESMNTDDFLAALRRMMNRRGKADTIYSDNAKTFKKAADILNLLFNPQNRKKIEDQFMQDGIKWKFITPRAPWQGAVYERLVKSVKVPLRKVLGKARLTVPELQNLLTDIEAQVNSRPLTDVSADPKDPLPITPGHLTVGRHLKTFPAVDNVWEDMNLGKRWLLWQKLSKSFWNRWQKEYLSSLSQRRKWFEEFGNAKVGDVVLISEDNRKKLEWPMARIEEVHPGRDGRVRSVTLRTKSGLIRRPVQRLRLLEGQSE